MLSVVLASFFALRFVALDSNIHYWLAGMRHRVGTKFNVLVLYYLISKEIAKGVVLI